MSLLGHPLAGVEVSPFCCSMLERHTNVADELHTPRDHPDAVIVNGFNGGLEWSMATRNPRLMIMINHCPWCGTRLSGLSNQAGVYRTHRTGGEP